jgi:SAM-dependent methyltransferase
MTDMLADTEDRALVMERLGSLADADQLAAEVDEPLSSSAPIAYDIAREFCRAGEPANDCRAYHAIWQYLRLTDVIRSVRSDGPLYVATAVRQARQGRLRRVLICGSADYSMLAYLGHAGRQAGVAPQFDLVDRCDTSLHMNRWYAEQRGLSLRTFNANIMEFSPDQPYDFICAHSFLVWMKYDDRPVLIKRWHDWLRPGGELCFSNRIDPPEGWSAEDGYAERIGRMSDRFFARCRELDLELPTDTEVFAQLIQQYGQRTLHRQRGMPLSTLRRWVESAGLTLDLSVPVAAIVAGAKDRASAPVQTEGRPRMWFLARRV